MALIQINRHPTRRLLNQFGFVWLGFLALFGAVARFRLGHETVATVLWMAAVVVPLIGWLVPGFMRVVYVGLSYLAWPIGVVVSHLVLAAVFYLVFTPIGLAMRLLRYDPMKRGFDPEASSYWVRRPDATADPRRYFRQF